MSEIKVTCPECSESEQIVKNGFQKDKQKYKCKMCWANFTEETEKVPEIAPETAKSDEQVAEEMKNPKYEAFKANYRNKFPEAKESKKYWFKFESWDEYYHLRAKYLKENPTEETK